MPRNLITLTLTLALALAGATTGSTSTPAEAVRNAFAMELDAIVVKCPDNLDLAPEIDPYCARTTGNLDMAKPLVDFAVLMIGDVRWTTPWRGDDYGRLARDLTRERSTLSSTLMLIPMGGFETLLVFFETPEA